MRRRLVPPTFRGSKWRADGRRYRRWRRPLAVGRRGLRVGGGRRLRRALRRAGRASAAGAAWAIDGRGRRASRDVLHRVDQRLRARTAAGRGDISGARRHQRHRHDCHPAGPRFRRHVSTRPVRGEKCEAARGLGASKRSTTGPTTGWRSEGGDHGHGADVILDMVGGDYVARNLGRWQSRAGWSRSRS